MAPASTSRWAASAARRAGRPRSRHSPPPRRSPPCSTRRPRCRRAPRRRTTRRRRTRASRADAWFGVDALVLADGVDALNAAIVSVADALAVRGGVARPRQRRPALIASPVDVPIAVVLADTASSGFAISAPAAPSLLVTGLLHDDRRRPAPASPPGAGVAVTGVLAALNGTRLTVSADAALTGATGTRRRLGAAQRRGRVRRADGWQASTCALRSACRGRITAQDATVSAPTRGDDAFVAHSGVTLTNAVARVPLRFAAADGSAVASVA